MPFGHHHKEQEEVYVVIGGAGRVKLDDEVVDLRRWDALRIPHDTMRNLEAGDEGIELILFGAPNAGPGDAEVTQGWWAE
jgi:mannose-6-phosphate isomerase-like protein (cupin superfamily)